MCVCRGNSSQLVEDFDKKMRTLHEATQKLSLEAIQSLHCRASPLAYAKVVKLTVGSVGSSNNRFVLWQQLLHTFGSAWLLDSTTLKSQRRSNSVMVVVRLNKWCCIFFTCTSITEPFGFANATLRNEVGIAHLQVALAHQFNSTPLVCC